MAPSHPRSPRPRTIAPAGGIGPGLLLVTLAVVAASASEGRPTAAAAEATPWAAIRVVDRATGRGVPIVELTTVNGLGFVTDDAGFVAFQEPGLMGRPVFFGVRGHGYELPADGFGVRGTRVVPRAGETITIEVERRNVAERLCRLTGEGRLRDSVLLGLATLPDPPLPGGVAGQDSVQAVRYGDRIAWFWGDTSRMSYPLGLFRTCGATTPLPDPRDPASDPASGIPYDYRIGPPSDAEPAGFVRPMMPLPERPQGVVWIDGVCVVPDAKGRERMLAHYTRREGLEGEFEQGIAAWDDATESFVVARQLSLDEPWRRPSTHPLRYEDRGPDGEARAWLLFGAPTPNVRVPATFEAVLDPDRYEAFSCLDDEGRPILDASGSPRWRWQRDLPPTGSADERRLVDEGLLAAEHCRFLPAAAGADGVRVRLHSGTVRWNEHRDRWILVAGEIGGSSHLGEVWYAEADSPTGPFTVAVKIVTHDRYSFYNVCHHEFLDRDGGRTIHFEGTFSREFSGNPRAVPRADYNQVLHRLDLDAEALAPARLSGGR